MDAYFRVYSTQTSKMDSRELKAVRTMQQCVHIMKLPDGRSIFVEVPGRWTVKDRSGKLALVPEGVRFLDQVRALAGNSRRPPSPGWITCLREALNLTQAEMGARLGVNKVTVSRWERGALRPSDTSLAAIERLRRVAVSRGVVLGA